MSVDTLGVTDNLCPMMTRVRMLLLSSMILVLLAVPPARAEESETVQQYLDSIVASGVPGIATAILKEGEPVRFAVAGEDGHGSPMTADTPMRIESLSKSVTALAVMQLVEAGEVDLDRPVRDYLPEFSLADPRAGDITVAHLLTHTSGMSDATGPDLYRDDADTLEEAVARLESATLAAAPGTASAYHNPNYHVAARLVEVISGQRFAGYLDQHVFTPIGMDKTTDTALATDRVEGMAAGHSIAYGRGFGAEGPTYFTEGSGGVVSTARDMAAWLGMQMADGMTESGDRVVSADSIRAMHTPRAEVTDDYGFGWYQAESAEGPPVRISHSGAGAGFGAYQGIFPDSGYGVIVLGNSGSGLTSPDPGVVAQNLLHLIDPKIPELSSSADGGRTDWILTALAVITVGPAVLGIARSRRWGDRRAGRRLPVTVLRLLPSTIPIAWFLALPSLQLFLTGRTAPYRLLLAVSPVGLTWFATWALACAVLLVLRIAFLVRATTRPA